MPDKPKNSDPILFVAFVVAFLVIVVALNSLLFNRADRAALSGDPDGWYGHAVLMTDTCGFWLFPIFGLIAAVVSYFWKHK